MTFSPGVSNAAAAAAEPITISTIAQPADDAGIDRATLRAAMVEAIKTIDPKQVRRPVTIALSIIETKNDPTTCAISIAVSDRKKGHILGTAAGTASATANARGDQRERVALIALSNAISRVPDVVAAN
ncbi:MAG: hypothetical protein KIT84_02900 [Labilithrix sp.]|nr:hypothetical protein [Labilithrix sp.]MCW5809930.1 hypothetical protein [Labilithrix sp.]